MHQRKPEKKINHRIVGMEAHYKIQIEEKVKITVPTLKKTVLLIGYKVFAHSLDLSPEDFLELKSLKTCKSCSKACY